MVAGTVWSSDWLLVPDTLSVSIKSAVPGGEPERFNDPPGLSPANCNKEHGNQFNICYTYRMHRCLACYTTSTNWTMNRWFRTGPFFIRWNNRSNTLVPTCSFKNSFQWTAMVDMGTSLFFMTWTLGLSCHVAQQLKGHNGNESLFWLFVLSLTLCWVTWLNECIHTVPTTVKFN